MKILGYRYKIVRDGKADDIGALGRAHIHRQRIQIAEDVRHDQLASTVLHEILEVLNYHMELGLGHNVIMSLESGLYQVLTEAGVDLAPLVDRKRNWRRK